MDTFVGVLLPDSGYRVSLVMGPVPHVSPVCWVGRPPYPRPHVGQILGEGRIPGEGEGREGPFGFADAQTERTVWKSCDHPDST